MAVDTRKVALIGCGFVGSASAFALMQSGLFSEMVLIDANTDKAEGEALDIAHGLSYAKPMQIYAGKYEDIADAAIIVISAGANQKPGETRLDLVKKNISIFRSIMGELNRVKVEGILLIVEIERNAFLDASADPIFPFYRNVDVVRPFDMQPCCFKGVLHRL